MSEQPVSSGHQTRPRFQKGTSYEQGTIRVTVDGPCAILTKLVGTQPMVTMVMTLEQACEVGRLFLEGGSSSDPMKRMRKADHSKQAP